MLLVALQQFSMLILDELLELLLFLADIVHNFLEVGIEVHFDFLPVVLCIDYLLPDRLLLLL